MGRTKGSKNRVERKVHKVKKTTKPAEVKLLTKRKKVTGRARKNTAHIDNVRGPTIRRAKHAAHYPITQDEVKLRRVLYQKATHEKARSEKPHVTISSGKHRVRDPMATFFNEFDAAKLSNSNIHTKGRSRYGQNSMPSAANELDPAIRGGGGSDVVRGPYGKISGLG